VLTRGRAVLTFEKTNMQPDDRSQPGLEGVPLSDQAFAQLYRGELGRSDRWRTRLDTTTNWALTTTAAVISFSFSNRNVPHQTLLVGIWMVTSFLLIEARRYRYYDLWIRRVRLLEDGYWAPMLRREPIDPDAIKELAIELSRPQIQLSLFSAVATRMNRAYGPLLLVLVLTWFVKLYSQPEPPGNIHDFVARAHIGPLSGYMVVAVMALYSLVAVVLVVASIFARPPLGELRARARSRKVALWEMFSRPYEFKSPRRNRPAANASTRVLEGGPHGG
jgi:uncharacterized membrane protein